MRDWAADAASLRRPAVIFNATATETGERFVLATVDPPQTKTGRDRRRSFHQTFPEFDIQPVTAARLSAGFPYVAPAARIDEWVNKTRRLHFVDGGYYDNFGVTALSELLQDAARQGFTGRVLFLEIGYADRPAKRVKVEQRGWFFQLFAPITTLISVRGTGQKARNNAQLDLLQQAIGGIAGNRIIRVPVPYQAERSEPLSWHLTEGQKQDIRNAWSRVAAKTIRDVNGFLGVPE
jgi:hypothetical protein